MGKGVPTTKDVLPGDRIYCQHPTMGCISAPVLSVGKSGVSIPHESGQGTVGVRWGAVLGHHTRVARTHKVLEQGEDGYICQDPLGKRVFVRGRLPAGALDGQGEQIEQEDPEEGKPLQKALLVDLGRLSCACTDEALEVLHKAMSEDGIQEWAKHESPFIQELIERFTQVGLLKSNEVRDELAKWIEGAMHVAGAARQARPVVAPGAWSELELGLAKVYLEALEPGTFTFDDWSLLIDYLVNRYMPASAMADQAQMLVAKAAMMGRVEAYQAQISAQAAVALLDAAPSTVKGVTQAFKYSDAGEAILEYARMRSADSVSGAVEALRVGVRKAVFEHHARKMAGDASATPQALQTTLLERFAKYNRDWRMIALTEAGEVCNQGVICALEPGSMVRRMEQYWGACPFCQKLDGRVFRVTTADDPDKDGANDVWPGKTNVGRAASPRMRNAQGELVGRPMEQRWWAAAGTQHPHCRGRWEPTRRLKPGQDPAFEKWMMEKAGIKFGFKY